MGENKSCMSLHAQWCCQAPRYPMRTPKPYPDPYPDPNRPPQLGWIRHTPSHTPTLTYCMYLEFPPRRKRVGPE